MAESAREAFVHGMNVTLWTCCAVAALGLVLALAFLPRRTGRLPTPSRAEVATIGVMTTEKPPGLRERKKAKTRAAIQEHALRLFRDQGYAETTVQEIAAAAEVSPATFFRYFPTKEDTVVFDRLDPMMIELFRSQPAELARPRRCARPSGRAWAYCPTDEWELESERQQLVINAPELRVRMLDQLYAGIDLLAGLAAERTGRRPTTSPSEPGPAQSSASSWPPTSEPADSPMPEYLATMDRAFDLLAAGHAA